MSEVGYEIGREYLVPQARGVGGAELPVIGGEHEDFEIIGNAAMHFHIDWRFAPEWLWQKTTSDSPHYGREFETVMLNAVASAPKMMRCLRQYRRFPREHAHWMAKLEAMHGGKELPKTCPHRGFPLRGCLVHEGYLECPGHGLRWEVTPHGV